MYVAGGSYVIDVSVVIQIGDLVLDFDANTTVIYQGRVLQSLSELVPLYGSSLYIIYSGNYVNTVFIVG